MHDMLLASPHAKTSRVYPASPSALKTTPRYSGEALSRDEPATARKRSGPERHCRFSTVQVNTYTVRLDTSKLPDKGPGVGLGDLFDVQLSRVSSFEEKREHHGVRRSSPEDRRQAVLHLHRCESIDEAERDVERIKRQRAESAAEVCEFAGSSLDQVPEFDDEPDFGISDLWK
ncbi:hypothetical protein AB1Y20_018406 [Prymnesium parvum]|uniref:Uncharacterized protein n=1 Tax=Prymnesium parvum TaxID=97485 RepID=A0AB34JQM2_PRYPA|mmetsp:Transcript_15903/g.38082  ORF Transcript_15903/g.38082 Transcript_15903/m.38082 type:complete len:174 (+) Transcript_15903:277-798(+)